MTSRCLLYMGVIIDVIHAVAVVAVALGAIAEFQIGILSVGPSANGTFMPV